MKLLKLMESSVLVKSRAKGKSPNHVKPKINSDKPNQEKLREGKKRSENRRSRTDSRKPGRCIPYTKRKNPGHANACNNMKKPA